MADTQENADFSGVTMEFDSASLISAMMPKLIAELSTNATLQGALVNSIMPGIRAQMATIARATAGAGTTTPRTGP